MAYDAKTGSVVWDHQITGTSYQLTRQMLKPRGAMPKMVPEPIDARLWIDLRGYLMRLPVPELTPTSR